MKKILFVVKMALIGSLIAGLLAVGGCGETYDSNAFHVFYINEDASELVPKEYDLEATELEQQVEELIRVMSENTGYVAYVKPIRDDLTITKFDIADGYLTLHFNTAYNELDNVSEVLCRSAVVKTLCQLEGIDGIWFMVDGIQIMDSHGSYVGMMTSDSFIDNPGEKIQNIQETELTLYYASADGKGLVKEIQEVHYVSNVSLEKLIVEHLLVNPITEGAQKTIPDGTKMINISVLDGICVVNFDDKFLTQNFELSEEVVIYSIVNSLTELPTIQTVQISVNGETNMVYREKFSLTEQYKRNLDLVIEESEIEEVVDDTQEKGGVLNNITE